MEVPVPGDNGPVREPPRLTPEGRLWHHLNVERTAYGTVVLMSVLVVYEGWAQLTSFVGTCIVIIAPTLALLLAHYFADVMAMHVQTRRSLRAAEWRQLSTRQTGIVLAAVPPLLIVLVGWLSPLDALSTIKVLLWAGVATLMFLSGLSARRAAYRGWKVVVAVALGGVVGVVVISMQVLLKPH